jgi:hypothetical protein
MSFYYIKMSWYTILKAVSNYTQFSSSSENPHSCIHIEKENTGGDSLAYKGIKSIYLTVISFGNIYGISISQKVVKIELLKDFGSSVVFENLIITDEIELSIIFSIFKISYPNDYKKLFTSPDEEVYNIQYLIENYKHYDRKIDFNIYLAMFALFGSDETGGMLKIKHKKYELTYEESNLTMIILDEDDNEIGCCDWPYMGRGLWFHLCEICKSLEIKRDDNE